MSIDLKVAVERCGVTGILVEAVGVELKRGVENTQVIDFLSRSKR
jgi:hypothetical protein